MKLTLIAISVAAVLGLFGLASRHAARRRSGRFKGRPELSLDEFFRQFYAQTEIPQPVVRDALWEIAAATGIREGSLRPEDRFDDALRPARGWEFDDGLSLLARDLAERARKAKNPINPDAVETVDDYIRTLYRLSLAANLPEQA